MFGSHLSIAGNLSNALREAETLALDTVQVFTKTNRQWSISVDRFREADRQRCDLRNVRTV